jgi:hypothetical protein
MVDTLPFDPARFLPSENFVDQTVVSATEAAEGTSGKAGCHKSREKHPNCLHCGKDKSEIGHASQPWHCIEPCRWCDGHHPGAVSAVISCSELPLISISFVLCYTAAHPGGMIAWPASSHRPTCSSSRALDKCLYLKRTKTSVI